jgi:PKD repeat protein
LGLALFASGSVFLSSCGEDSIVPIVDFLAEPSGFDAVKGYAVTITAEATDAEKWLWNYGDGTSSDSVGNHTYYYKAAGTFKIVCEVASSDGTKAKKEVSVTVASPQELLAGTATSHPNGKTWILDKKYNSGKDGAGPLTSGLPITQPFLVDNVLDVMLGLGVEYDNEYTFKSDGKLTINNKNGISLGSQMYAFAVAQTGPAPGFTGGNGLCGIAYTPKANGTYQFKTQNVSMDVVIEDPANLGAGYKEGKYTASNQLVITPTDYFGFLEITKEVFVKSIKSDRMHVVFLMHGVVQIPNKPSTAIHVTMIPKP